MRTIAILGVAACLCTALHAHSAQPAAAHGGQTRMAGPYLLELVTGHDTIVIYVTDHAGRPVDTAGGKGRAVVHTDGRAVTIEVRPAQTNALDGHGRYRLKRSSVVYVTVDLKSAPPHRTVFRPLAGTTARASGRTRH
jgi:hypothetical protein